MRQYRLPDEYRIVQDSVNDLFLAVNVEDSAKSLDMLRALEDEFRIYPPYWVYRARSAQKAGNSQEAAKCFEEFSKVWRPVLRNDPFMLEAAKYHVQEALKSGNHAEALRHLETVRENTARSDWADNLFAGVSYFILGRKEQGINCVELNINFEAEKEISSAVLAQMKAGKLDTSALPGELRKIVGLSALRYDTLVLLAESGDLEAQLMLGKFYADGEIVSKDYAESVKWYEMAAKQNNEIAILALAGLYTQGGYNLKKNIEQAKSWYEKAAYEGSRAAQNGLAHLFFNAKDYYNAYVWCCVAEMTENFDRTLQTGFSVGVGAGAAGMAMLTGAAFLPVFLPVAGFMLIMSELGLDNNIKDDIEGAGLFSFAKLSSSEMDKAKIEAGKIMSEIERRIKQKQQQPSMP